MSFELPGGFTAHIANVGIRDTTDDFVVVASERPCTSAAVFTRSRFAGPSVVLSRRHAAAGDLQVVAVVSKNANVATGPQGAADAAELADGVASALGVRREQVLVASTGVIGRPYPMDRVRHGLTGLVAPPAPQEARATLGTVSVVMIPRAAAPPPWSASPRASA